MTLASGIIPITILFLVEYHQPKVVTEKWSEKRKRPSKEEAKEEAKRWVPSSMAPDEGDTAMQVVVHHG